MPAFAFLTRQRPGTTTGFPPISRASPFAPCGARNGFADTSEALRQSFAKNPDMMLLVASGHFDLATPYFATQYTLAHLGLDASQRARITTHEYEAGHMMYIHTGELARLRRDVGAFLKAALPAP